MTQEPAQPFTSGSAGGGASPAESPYRVTGSHTHFQGRVFGLLSDEVATPEGLVGTRDYVTHIGAVAVVAVDDEGRVVLVRQYRHPVRAVLWELPAGLLDVEAEDHVEAAARELAEETGLTAGRWEPLVTVYTSPGYSTERIDIFLAHDLSPVEDGFAFERVFEEATMTVHRVPLDEAAAMVDRAEIVNGVAAVGLLAAWRRLRT